ncbi:MAG: radical SAM protein [Promethearchaeota archaeon]
MNFGVMVREYIYGPFPSRRLGLSLGVDILLREKTCSFNCVYCEIGPTIRNNWVSPFHEIKRKPSPNFRKELTSILKYYPHLDSITFGYNGEPTLNPYIEEYWRITSSVREEFSWKKAPPKITLFTNSSTLFRQEVREKIKYFDLILAKLDAANEVDFQETNHPHEEVLSIHEIIDSLVFLKKELPPGKELVLQCLFYNSYKKDRPSNNNPRNLRSLIEAIKKIKPSRVQIYTIARIPSEPHVHALSPVEILNIAGKIKEGLGEHSIKIEPY